LSLLEDPQAEERRLSCTGSMLAPSPTTMKSESRLSKSSFELQQESCLPVRVIMRSKSLQRNDDALGAVEDLERVLEKEESLQVSR